MSVPSAPPPPPPPPLNTNMLRQERQTNSALRATYLNAFNQIFDNSINVNCICKTTILNANTNTKKFTPSSTSTLKFTPLRSGNRQQNIHNDFMSSDEDENETTEQSKTQKNVTNFLDEIEKKLIELELLPADDPIISKMQCDCSCFENLRCVYNVLKSCFRNSSVNINECIANFEIKWSRYLCFSIYLL